MDNYIIDYEDFFDYEDEAIIPENLKKFLSFCDDDLYFVIDAENVSEIITNISITYLPKAPDFIRGIIDLRGQIIPIVDIRVKMGMKPSDNMNVSCIIIVQILSTLFGILVEKVSHVLDIDIDMIASYPAQHQAEELTSGIVRIEDMVYLVFDAEKLMRSIGGANGFN